MNLKNPFKGEKNSEDETVQDEGLPLRNEEAPEQTDRGELDVDESSATNILSVLKSEAERRVKDRLIQQNKVSGPRVSMEALAEELSKTFTVKKK